MIRATDVRIVGLVLLLAAAFVGGCKPASSGTGKAPTLNIAGPGQNQDSTNRPPAAEYLGGFLKKLAEGKAGPDDFTAAFKAKVARPKYMNEQHQKLGYDPNAFDAFLKKAAKGSFDSIEAAPTASGVYFASMGKIAGKTENCLVRLVPTDDAAGWRIGWLQRTAVVAPAFRDASLQPQQVEARIAAVAFLSTMLDGQFDLAEALMTKAYKGDLAWSNTPSNEKQGYDSGLLQNLRLKQWKGAFNEFTIASQDIAEGKPAVIEGEMLDAAKQSKKPFKLILTKEPDGEWLLSKFEAK